MFEFQLYIIFSHFTNAYATIKSYISHYSGKIFNTIAKLPLDTRHLQFLPKYTADTVLWTTDKLNIIRQNITRL